MTRLTPISSLHRRVLEWYSGTARDYPWRRTREPFVILCSEIMLQQTQADRVAEKLPVFLRRFPTVDALARATPGAVIRAWRGMGYNRRAVSLHAAARAIVKRHKTVPSEIDALRALPGVGRYTAHAVACFSMNQRVPVVDVNVRRVLSRIVSKRRTLGDLMNESDAWDLAAQLLPRSRWYEWNQALMELGARVCKARSAECELCPLRQQCPSRDTLINARPVPRPKAIEAQRNGIPNRIWRGKIIETLRRRRFANARLLGNAIDPKFTARDVPWINELLVQLRRDGLVRIGPEIRLVR